MNEQDYDQLFNIETTKEQHGFNKSTHYHRYEATPYVALEYLFQDYTLDETDSVVDYGCGKGRLNFYIHYHFGARVTGVEMNDEYYLQALENKETYLKKHKTGIEKIDFQSNYAQDYQIKPEDNKFYFFNPFSIQIFMKIINNILMSVEDFERKVEVVLYYPSEDYIYYLENETPFRLKKEIILPVLHENNERECFLIYDNI